MEEKALLEQLSEAVIRGKLADAQNFTRQALERGIPPVRIVNEGLIPGMLVVGEKFKNNEYYIPEVLVAARAMKGAMEIVRPLITETDLQPIATVVIGTVQGDLHDIGKNLVAMMLEGAGFRVVDLGVDVAPERFLEAAEKERADIVAMSALLTTTMPAMGETIRVLEEKGVRERFIVMVGGAPVTDEFARQIGADGYAPDAGSAVDLAKELVSSRKRVA